MKASDINDILKVILVPIHVEGVKFILIFALVTVILSMMSSTLGMIGVVLTLWCVFFFRDPPRVTPNGENLVISSGDGVVTAVERSTNAPRELMMPNDVKWTKVSIFLNVFNVHVNRVPISGKITKLNYQKGKFLSASFDGASLENERQTAVVKTAKDQEIIFAQVAGLVARRIVCDLREGQEVKAGEKYGIIRFGSRVDIYLPNDAEIKAMVGQTMIGGETVIAQLKN